MIFTNDQTLWNDNYQVTMIPSFIDDIKPIYQIDTYGTIINIQTNLPIIPHVNDHGYWFGSFMTNSGSGRVHRKIHRIVLLSFNYIPGCESLHANHKDGNKRMNHLANLEWMTAKENKNHGIQSKKAYGWFGDHDPLSIATPDIVNAIGSMLLSGTRMDYIIRAFPIFDVPAVYQIATGGFNPGNMFTPEQIDLMSMNLSERAFSILDVHKICEQFQIMKENNITFSNPRKRNIAILTNAGIEPTMQNRRYASRIYNRFIFSNISSNYDF